MDGISTVFALATRGASGYLREAIGASLGATCTTTRSAQSTYELPDEIGGVNVEVQDSAVIGGDLDWWNDEDTVEFDSPEDEELRAMPAIRR